MRKNEINLLKNVSKLKALKFNEHLYKHLQSRATSQYGGLATKFLRKGSTKFVAFCLIQGTPKRTLKVFKFNRHLVRSGSVKKNFNSLNSISW